MIREVEPRKFRIGESTGKPWGGNVSPDPFPQALYNLARSRGYESQLSLAQALCKRANVAVGLWYGGKRVPLPDEFGKILRLLKPNNEELDALLEPYGKLLQEGKGRKGGNLADSESTRRQGFKQMLPAKTPFEAWVKRFCQEKKLTLTNMATLLGFNTGGLRERGFGIQTYSEILQNAQQALGLSEEEVTLLGDTVAQTIEQRIAEGHKFTDSLHGTSLKKIQRELACVTYTGHEAAEKLGITRERVRQLRQKLGLPLLLTEGHIEILRERRGPRRKIQDKTTLAIIKATPPLD